MCGCTFCLLCTRHHRMYRYVVCADIPVHTGDDRTLEARFAVLFLRGWRACLQVKWPAASRGCGFNCTIHPDPAYDRLTCRCGGPDPHSHLLVNPQLTKQAAGAWDGWTDGRTEGGRRGRTLQPTKSRCYVVCVSLRNNTNADRL